MSARGRPPPDGLERAAERLEALGRPIRLRVYRTLVHAAPRGHSVGDLQALLDIPRSTLSFHLRRLIEAGLVLQERQGTTLVCHADFAAMTDTLGFLQRECGGDMPPACGRRARVPVPARREAGAP